MIEQIVQTECGILFDYDAFPRWHIPPIGKDKPLSPPQGGVTSTSEDTDALDAQDAVQKITDKLFSRPLWWIAEIFPTSYTDHDKISVWR